MYSRRLGKLPLFQGFDETILTQLGPLTEMVHYPSGVVVFSQGEFADYLYILRRGEVSIHYKPYDGTDYILVTVHAGGVFGWSSALSHELYSSSAIAKRASDALRLPGRQLQRLCDRYPESGCIFLERLASLHSDRARTSQAEVVRLISSGMKYNESKDNRRGANG
jgi:CRP/FNR family cyclic AMP-dependent transcriptional regulator